MDTQVPQNTKYRYRNSHHIQFLRQRAQDLYRTGQEVARRNTVLRTAFDELATVLDLLQEAERAYEQQCTAWLDERAELEVEIQRYQDMFAAAPLPYIVTSLDGTIRQANTAATELLGAPEKLLVGRALAFFTPEGHRREFRNSIADFQQREGTQRLEIDLQPWEGTAFRAELIAVVTRSRDGKPQYLRWQIQDISACKRTEQQLREQIAELEQRLSATART